MSVTATDVRHVASLARLGLSDERVESVVAELNGILAHMSVLLSVDTSTVELEAGNSAVVDASRPDAGPPAPMARTREDIAPRMADGFFLVPRLSTHEDVEVGEDVG